MRASRWPAALDGGDLTIVVTSDPREAAAFAQRMGLSGDPRGAHTHPRLHLAVLPLPRADSLVLDAPLPPATWLQTFRHEAAHLLSLDRPGLRAAPRWFQEGFAEGLAAFGAGSLPPPWNLEGLGAAFLARAKEQDFGEGGRRLLETLSSLPGEARLDAWRELVQELLEGFPGENRPWEEAAHWTVADWHPVPPNGLDPDEPGLRGREFDPPGPEHGMLLAAYPGEVVSAVWTPRWDGRSEQAFTIQVGRTGLAEGGLILSGPGTRRLRLRFSKYGRLGAHLEEGDTVESRPLSQGRPGAEPGTPQRVRLRVEAGRLLVEGPGFRRGFPLEEGIFSPPFRLEFLVRDGALRVAGPGSASSGS